MWVLSRPNQGSSCAIRPSVDIHGNLVMPAGVLTEDAAAASVLSHVCHEIIVQYTDRSSPIRPFECFLVELKHKSGSTSKLLESVLMLVEST